MGYTGYLVLESGEVFGGQWLGGEERAGEVVFNTSHNGYEEIATDPSYYGQIMVMCAPQQGNYGVDDDFWESRQLWIEGFIALEIEKSPNQDQWLQRLRQYKIPTIEGMDTRKLVLSLREQGTQVGALVQATSASEAKEKSVSLINRFKEQERDWVYRVSRTETETLTGDNASGPKVAVLDFGCKENILRELRQRSSSVTIYPSRTSAETILQGQYDGVLLSNGPGDPENVEQSVATIQNLLGKLPVFGICMGHQLLARALGADTFKLKFGHRGANHPIKNQQTGEVFMTSQNHGYAVSLDGLKDKAQVTHMNLNDNTVSGLQVESQKCFSVQFHPESHPGPRDASGLFDQFVSWMQA